MMWGPRSGISGMATFHGWQFVKAETFGQRQWHWQRMTVDGSISIRSGEFGNYGEVVTDAIVHGGFQPSCEGWCIITDLGVTHFEPQRKQITAATALKQSENCGQLSRTDC